MRKDDFIIMMDAAENFSAEADRWNDFGINIFELPIYDIPWQWFYTWVDNNFTNEGRDWIDWYLYERISITTGEVLACWDEDGNEFFVETIEELWDIVKDYVKDASINK